LTIGTMYHLSKTVKNSQKTVKTAKITIGVPIVTCLQNPPNTQSRANAATSRDLHHIIIIIIIITDLYSAFRSEDTEALDAAQEE